MKKQKILLVNINNLNYSKSSKDKELVGEFASAFLYFENMCPNIELKNSSFITDEFKNIIEQNKTIILNNSKESGINKYKSTKTFVLNNNEWSKELTTFKFINSFKNDANLIFANYDFDNKKHEIKENFEKLDCALFDILNAQEFNKNGFLLMLIINNKIAESVCFITLNKKSEFSIKSKNDILELITKTLNRN